MYKNWLFLFTAHSLFGLTTLHVSLPTDLNPGGFGDSGDLRWCINTMNTNLSTSAEDYAIVFDMPMTIELNGLLPVVNNSMLNVNITIGNSGSTATTTIDGNGGTYGGFFIPAGIVTIQNMKFQNLTAKGGDGGNGISGGGGGLGAGGAIYAPSNFLISGSPAITLMNVSIENCTAEGGTGGAYSDDGGTGTQGAGGGGGFWGNGGSVSVVGSSGGGGGGGFGGNGGTVLTPIDDPLGGGGGGGGGFGSRATIGMLMNLGTGGGDQDDGNQEDGLAGNGYGLVNSPGMGGGGYAPGANGGGGGGGNAMTESGERGGGGGGSAGGTEGQPPRGGRAPGFSFTPSGGSGADGGGGGGGGVVINGISNLICGAAGNGGYGGGGGGGAGLGSDEASGYTVEGGVGGTGGGGGGGGVNGSGDTLANGGNSLGGGGGGGGGPTNGSTASPGGMDIGYLGGGSGGIGATVVSAGSGGGGGGGGSGLGGAIFIDSGIDLTIKALSGVPTLFNTVNTLAIAGNGGEGASGAEPGNPGSALGNSIFMRQGSRLFLTAEDTNDLLTLGEEVSFVDDTSFGGGSTDIYIDGNGTVVYNGTTDFQGNFTINSANFKVNGLIGSAIGKQVSVCRITGQRGTLSGNGTIDRMVFVNSGIISPDPGQILTLRSLTLNPEGGGSLGSLVHIEIDAEGTSSVSVTDTAALAGFLEIDLDSNALPGSYVLLTSSGLTGTFDSVLFPQFIPTSYSLSYLPLGMPTYVQFEFSSDLPPVLSTQGLRGNNRRVANYLNALRPEAESLGLRDQYELLNNLPFSEYENALEAISPARTSISTFAAQNVMFMFSESLGTHFTKRRLASKQKKNRQIQETALLAENEELAMSRPAHSNPSPRDTMYAPPKNTSSQIWATGFGGFNSQNSQDQTPSFHFNNGGFFVAYDYGNTDQGCIGTLAGYAHTSIQQHNSVGNSQLNAGYISVYGMKSFSDFYLDAAIWGQYMGVDQKRTISYPGFDETAKSSYHAGQLDLHFGTGYDFNISTGTIEPFALLDWVCEWDPSYSEKGAAPYNMKISSRTSWMLRFETGLNGYNTTTYNWGTFIAQAKLSYVYKKPHNVGQVNAAIVSAPTSFVVESFTSAQSLFSPAIELFWQTNWNGYGSISYDGEFGSGYSSNQFYGKIGYSF